MTPYYDDGRGIVIYHGDAREILPTLEPGSVDLVLTDPPYGTGGWRRLEAGAGSNPSGSLVQEAWDDGALDWLSLVDAPVVATFWPAARTSLLLEAATARGLTKHRCIYWRKPDPKPLPGGRTRWSVEPIWVLSHDGFVLTGGDDMFEMSALRRGCNAEWAGHPYQKPVRLLCWGLAKFRAGLILDPFAGSGSTLVAAKRLGVRAVGVETEERYCEIAARRLSQEVMDFGGVA